MIQDRTTHQRRDHKKAEEGNRTVLLRMNPLKDKGRWPLGTHLAPTQPGVVMP